MPKLYHLNTGSCWVALLLVSCICMEVKLGGYEKIFFSPKISAFQWKVEPLGSVPLGEDLTVEFH